MDIFAAYLTDTNKETSGVWVPLSKDVEVLVARNGTRGYTRALTKEVERYSLALEAKDDQADEVSEMIVIGVMADHVLLGWKGFTDAAGNEVPYSKEQAKKYLALKDFRKKISSIADDMSNYKAKQEAATSKNS